MTLNPDDLLIFKEREESGKKRKKDHPVSPSKIIEEAEPQQQPLPQQRTREGQQQKTVEKQETSRSAEIKITRQTPQPKPQQERQPQQYQQPQSQRIEPITVAPEVGEQEMRAAEMEMTPEGRKKEERLRIKGKKLRASESRKIAARMNCDIHPWRTAYAICDYCKRPFCYEDIMEYNGAYYCLEDIDKVSHEMRQSMEVKYTRLSFLSALCFLMVLIVFIYFQGSSLLSLASTLHKSGLQAINLGAGLYNVILIIALLLSLMSFSSGIMVMLSSRNSFKMSAVSGIAIVILFSYLYLNTLAILYGVIAALSFIGLVSLAYSKVSLEELPDEEFFASGVVPPAELANGKGI
jgi:hypothetical protein